jgi:serine O-acetyltransferase
MRDVLRALSPRDSAAIPSGPWAALRGLATPQVRSVLYQRLYNLGGRDRMLAKLFSRVSPGLREFELVCGDIGPGLVIGHGYSSVIWAERIGRDCLIYQQVTIGADAHDGFPIIGDRVTVFPGAKVIGGITIGDDAIIGAGALAVHDVPSGAIMAGVPARQIGTTLPTYSQDTPRRTGDTATTAGR